MGHIILNHNLILILLIHLFLWVTVVNGQFIPGPRAGHTANLVGNKIYFIGGSNFSEYDESEVFYYGGDPVTWINLNSQGVKLPARYGHSANIGGTNQDLIFIIGGETKDTNLVYVFDTKSNKIDIPTRGSSSINRSFMGSASHEGKIYLFGGIGPNDILYNNLNIFDTINLNWEVGGLINAPPPRYKHTATLVNGVIYYIGGKLQIDYESMTNIHQYNIVSDRWFLKIANLAPGNVLDPRAGHSAVLVEGKICICGGTYYNYVPDIPIAMLDTDTLQWSIPQFKNPRRPDVPNLPNLIYHTATLVDKRMLIAFGNDSSTIINGFSGLNNHFYIFDFNSSEWFETTADELANPSANIPKLQFPSTSNSSDAVVSSNSSAIIGLSVGIVLAVLAVVGALMFIYYRRKRNQSREDGHPSDDSSDQITSSQRSTLYANQQYAPSKLTNQHFTPQPNISDNNSLTQSQEYSDFILPIPSDGDRFHNHSSNYYPGSESHSQRSEFPALPPPPPPKTL
ncbi:hypothetical protein RclHR1_09740003 [Rhizophagus clarus]|uniref:Galactose oxidase n=1 Tax=Rhizophagus clarus TaxID=94130 RepID=A0A2Z6S5E5_9GLOM|nr:hypothetical protein RclHR1_09740003 [Rhizophagus clarus]GES99998.1 hypothetical protein GLOIN_2v1537221 [Rhizophagus clarus]